MEVHFAAEIEKKLVSSAAQQGRNPDDVVQEAVAKYFDEERQFLEAVGRGKAALERGESERVAALKGGENSLLQPCPT